MGWSLAWTTVTSVAAVVGSGLFAIDVPVVILALQGAAGPLVAAVSFVAVLAAYRRRPHLWRAAAMVVGVLVADLAAGHLHALPHRASPSPHAVRVVAANLLWENRSVGEVVAAVVAEDPDVLVTVETIDHLHVALEAEFDGRLVPVSRQRDTTTPVVVWARPSLKPTAGPSYTTAELPSVDIVDLAGHSLRIVGVHVESPERADDVATWRGQLQELTSVLRDSSSIVLAGDFNASRFHAPMRALLDHAIDAAAAAGKVWLPTWPTGRSRSVDLQPPLRSIDLDHVVVGGPIGVVAVDRFELPGSDHDGVTATLVVRER